MGGVSRLARAPRVLRIPLSDAWKRPSICARAHQRKSPPERSNLIGQQCVRETVDRTLLASVQLPSTSGFATTPPNVRKVRTHATTPGTPSLCVSPQCFRYPHKQSAPSKMHDQKEDRRNKNPATGGVLLRPKSQ